MSICVQGFLWEIMKGLISFQNVCIILLLQVTIFLLILKTFEVYMNWVKSEVFCLENGIGTYQRLISNHAGHIWSIDHNWERWIFSRNWNENGHFFSLVHDMWEEWNHCLANNRKMLCSCPCLSPIPKPRFWFKAMVGLCYS